MREEDRRVCDPLRAQRRGWADRMTSNRHLLVLATLAVAVLAAIPLGLPLVFDVDGDDLSRDVGDTAKLPWWTGAISFAGLMLWSAAAAVCALGAALLRDRRAEGARFLLATSALLLVAAVDDALQLHETVAPEELGVPEKAVYALLGLAALAWAVRFRREILATRLWVLAGAAVFFLGMGLSDTLVIGPTAAEDWLKNSGIAILLLWGTDTVLTNVRAEFEPLSAPRPTRAPAAATPRPGT